MYKTHRLNNNLIKKSSSLDQEIKVGRKKTMEEAVKDKDFLETIVRSIVAKPEGVSVERTVDEMGVLLTLKVDPEDMGNVIGRRGQTAQAIRTLLKIVGAKNNARVNLKIYDPNQGQSGSGSNRNEEVNTSEKVDTSEEVDTSSVEDLKI